jgi:hypothetical protein
MKNHRRTLTEELEEIDIGELSSQIAGADSLLKNIDENIDLYLNSNLFSEATYNSFVTRNRKQLVNTIKKQYLFNYMSNHNLLSRYLSHFNNENSIIAFGMAKSDLEYMKNRAAIKEKNKNKFENISLWILKSVMIPIVLIFLTAYIGNHIATTLQQESFKRERFFVLGLESLREGRELSIKELSYIRSKMVDIEDQEMKYDKVTLTTLEILRSHREKLIKIPALSEHIDKKRIIKIKAIEVYNELDNYITCLEKGGKKNQNNTCTGRLNLDPFGELISEHGKAIINLAK